MKKLIYLIFFTMAMLVGHSWQAAAMEPFTAQVVGVPTPKTLLLSDDRIVRLASIQTPNLGDGGQGNRLAREAQDWLQKNVENKLVDFEPVMDTPDRKGRIVARAFVKKQWVQTALVERGLAWVYTFPDTARDAKKLLEAEQRAQSGLLGIWSAQQYQVTAPETAVNYTDQFRLFKGTIDRVEERGKKYLIFWKTPTGAPTFVSMIDRADRSNFDPSWFATLPGKKARVRGWPFASGDGTGMLMTHPEQLELLK